MNARLGLIFALLVVGAGVLFWLGRSDDHVREPARLVSQNAMASQPVTTPRLPGAAHASEEPRGHHGADAHREPDDPDAIARDGDGEPDDEEPAADEKPTEDDGDDGDSDPGPPPVKPGEKTEPVGTLSKEEIQAAIKAVVPRVRACFEKGLEKEPDLAGRVVVQFEIEAKDGQGVVSRGEVPESETFSPFFDACVLEEVAGAEFPAPEGGGKVTVRYPFQFDPGGGYGGAPPEER